MLQFENEYILLASLALIPLVILFIYVIRWKQKVKHQLGDARLVSELIKDYSSSKFRIKYIFIFSAVLLIIVAAANLRKPLQGKSSVANGIDVMIALDISKSMLSEDVKPSRLEKAKQLINQLTDKLQNNRIGLVVFAGQAYLQMPLTADITAAKMLIADASPELVSMQGTNFSDALKLCDASLDTKEKKYKSVVLITDGEDQDDKAIESAKQLTENGTVLHTVGVGSAQGSPIIEPGTNEYKKDANGQTIISKLNEKLLIDLAAQTNGEYHSLNNAATTADEIANALNGMEKKSLAGAGGYIEYKSYYLFFLIIAVALLITEIFISEKRKIITI